MTSMDISSSVPIVPATTISSSVSSSSSSSSPSPPQPRGVYIVHAQHPTIITHSLTCNFTSPQSTNLILARSSRLDVMSVTPSGLSLLKELPIYGRIAAVASYLPPRSSQHRLIITTEDHRLFTLSTDPSSSHFLTPASVDLTHKVGQLSDHGQTILVNPQSNLIAVHQYEGVLSCIAIDNKGQLGEVVDVRIEEHRVIDMQFLYTTKPIVCILYRDYKEKRHCKTFVIDTKEREAKPGPLSITSLDHSPVKLIPTEDGGVMIVGEESVVLYDKAGKVVSHVLLTPCTITSWCRIDSTRFLIADLHGDLSMIIMQTSTTSPPLIRLHRELLGHTTIASTLCYLGDSHVFLGSTLGDHQLVQLRTERGEDGAFLSVIDTFPNLGAIVDMAVMDLDQQGQGQLVTCSGAFQCGSLRVVRNGVGVEEEASIELSGIQGMWGVKEGAGREEDKFLVQSFVGETRVLAMEEDELGEIEMEGLEAGLPTIWAGNVEGGEMIQITEASVRMIDTRSMQLLHEWKEGKITVGTSNRAQVIVAMGKVLCLLRWEGGRLREEKRVTLDNEVACVDCTPMEEGEARFAVIGMWNDLTLRILSLPSLSEVSREAVGGEVIPRSVLLCPFSPSSVFLLAGLGDGHLLSFTISPSSGALSQRKSLTLGSQPIALSPFFSSSALHIFAACDRPTVVYCAQGRLLYSNVNLKDVHHMTSFSTSTFPSSLAFASSTHLVIGPIDSIQKLHIQTISLGAQPRKVAWYRQQRCLIVLVSRFVKDESRRAQQGVGWREVSEVLALDDATFEVQSRIELERDEVGSALFVTREALHGDLYVVVGVTSIIADEEMPKKGRLILMRVEGKQQLSVVSSTPTKGAVYCIDQVQGKVVAGINSKVVVYKCIRGGVESEARLLAECSHIGKTLTIALAIHDSYIVAGDLFQSVSILVYNPGARGSVPSVELVARDWDSAEITALSSLWAPPAGAASAPPPLFLASDTKHNLFFFQRSSSPNEEDRTRVEIAGKFHLGDYVNVIRSGSLVMAQQSDIGEGRFKVQASHLIGTIGGGVLVVAVLGRDEFVWLSRLEEALEKCIGGVGRLEHKAWRATKGNRGMKDITSVAFVDGDLIEMAMELRGEQQMAVSQQMGMPWAEVLRRVEEVSRIH